MTVKKTLSGRSVGLDEAEHVLNQEVIPVLAEARESINDLDSQPVEVAAAGSMILRFDLHRRIVVPLTESIASITIVNPPGGGDYTVLLEQAGGFVVSGWPSNVRWFGGAAPTITLTAGSVDMIRMHFDGEVYYAEAIQNAF